MILWDVLHPLTLTTVSGGFEAEVFAGRMPFMSPNQMHQSVWQLQLF